MLTDAERERMKARYFWDTRRKTDDPESEGYGYDYARMFRDLESAEAAIKAEHPSHHLPGFHPGCEFCKLETQHKAGSPAEDRQTS